MPVLLRLLLWTMGAVCCVSVAATVANIARVATATYSPFGFLSAGILVAAIGYAVAQLRRR